MQLLAEIPKMMTETKCEPEQFTGRMIFMSVSEMYFSNSQIVTEHAKRFAHGDLSFLVLGSQKKWYGTRTYKPNAKWDRVAEETMLNFSESGHPVFRGSCALERGDLKSKGEIVFPLLCQRSSRSDSFRTIQKVQLFRMYKSPRTDENVQGNLLQDYEQQFANLPYHLQFTKLCSNEGISKTVVRGQYFTTLDAAELEKL